MIFDIMTFVSKKGGMFIVMTKCYIVLTNTAREAIKQHFTDEHAFFNYQSSYFVYLEKQSIEETSLTLTIYFDNVRNKKLSNKFNERVVILDCVFDLKNGLVAKNFRTKGKNTPIKTNRRQEMNIRFIPSRISGHTYPEQFIKTVAELPVSKEKYDYVNKRITSWEGYLKVLYKNANIEDIDAKLHSVNYSGDFSTVTIKLQEISDKQWKLLKGLNVYSKGFNQEIGEVTKVNNSKQTVEIELSPKVSKLAKENVFDFSTDITFSNASTKSQLNRLLKGFERLKEGLSVNPNLENFLFEDRPIVEKRKNNLQIDFHNNLNEYQREAVIGALEAEDLYVIQGPPGTGKTTVISEICFQNVKMGLKTLIASQSNLAVDNALDRLLLNKDIRILRYGRTDSIEEEGKKFIEENVAGHWKAQTYDYIRHEISQHDQKESLLKEEIAQLQNQIAEQNAKIEQLEQEIVQKKQAEAQLQENTKKISQLKKEISALNKEREKCEKSIATLQQSAKERKAKLEEMETSNSGNKIQLKIEEIRQNIKNNENKIYYLQLQDKISNTQTDLEKIINTINQHSKNNELEHQLLELKSLKKIDEVKQFMKRNNLKTDFKLEQLFMTMDHCYREIMKLQSVKYLSERIEKAVEFNYKTLNIQVENVQLPENHTYSLSEVEQFLNKLALAFKQQKINQQNGVPSIRGLYLRRIYINELKTQFHNYVHQSKATFEQIKEALEKQLKAIETFESEKLQSLKEKAKEYENLIDKYKLEQQQLQVDTENLPSINDLLANIIQLNEEMANLTKEQQNIQNEDDQIEKLKNELNKITEELQNGNGHLQQLTEQYKKLNKQGITLEKETVELQQIVKQNPEAQLEKTKEQIHILEEKIKKIQSKIELLPVTKEIQKEWFSLLEQASEQDLDEIRKLYVKHANVIGTTCVASANKEFMDNYPDFDVVIIDEVSKATPPELLLPMLKGKKIILVGDHHQLPPLIGDDTFEETLEEVLKESNTFEEKRELEKLLEESLFERLYKNLPNTNKKMLGIQYRMHENIMETIVPFYQNGNETLHCGLQNSDEMRDHKLNGEFISRENHLLWFDLPNEAPYFEERMKEGSSLFNKSELEMIRLLLIDINDACMRAKEQGLMEEEECKSVGVISFYREQVNRINRLIEELHLPHLHIRTGSVDKFQGMEMDVILLSMVRNNNNPHGDIGFAKDYRRLNVALSRARELLLLIGSSEMFMNRPKKQETREMYKHLFEIVEKQQGIRQMTGVLT